MATNTDADDPERYPTAGPARNSYQRYRAQWTEDGELLVYDADSDGAWIQSASGIGLEFMR